jgi:hypothetical protein
MADAHEANERMESRERSRLRGIVDPATTAVLTMELQKGIVGADAVTAGRRIAPARSGDRLNVTAGPTASGRLPAW